MFSTLLHAALVKCKILGTNRAVTFWCVFRWAECEAYRTSNSDLRLLRQLLLEDGFWCIKDEADSCYRALRKSRPAEAFAGVPAAANTGDQDTSAQLENSNGVTELESGEMGTSGTVDLPAGELRQSGRGSRFVPAWLHPQEPAPKVRDRNCVPNSQYNSVTTSGSVPS